MADSFCCARTVGWRTLSWPPRFLLPPVCPVFARYSFNSEAVTGSFRLPCFFAVLKCDRCNLTERQVMHQAHFGYFFSSAESSSFGSGSIVAVAEAFRSGSIAARRNKRRLSDKQLAEETQLQSHDHEVCSKTSCFTIAETTKWNNESTRKSTSVQINEKTNTTLKI